MNASVAAPEPDPTTDWHAPPARAVRLQAALWALALAALALPPALLLLDLAAEGSRVPALRPAAAALLALAAALGALLGARLRYQRWKLDGEGLWLRQGRLWWRETRVPASRVQHVDLKHGPLQRRLGLATLVVHTAAVHLGGVAVRGLDRADAEALRDALARPLDEAGDAL